MTIIVLKGPSNSGKTTVAGIISSCGYNVYKYVDEVKGDTLDCNDYFSDVNRLIILRPEQEIINGNPFIIRLEVNSSRDPYVNFCMEEDSNIMCVIGGNGSSYAILRRLVVDVLVPYLSQRCISDRMRNDRNLI